MSITLEIDTLMTALREPLLVVDERLSVVVASGAFCRVFGVAPAEAAGMRLTLASWLDDRLLRRVTALRDHGVPFDGCELEGPVDGRTLIASGRRVLPADGPAMLLLTFEDVTRQRAVDRARDEKLDEFERSNVALHEFASVAAHDLREPLRKVTTYLERLERRIAGLVDAGARSDIERIRDAVSRMQARIDGVLELARVSSAAPALAPVDLAQVLAGVVGDLQPAIRESGARIHVGPLPGVEGDAALLSRVFQNLIANALKFRRPGASPLIRIGAEAGAAEEPPGTWRIAVEDDGIGFDARLADTMFKPFQRLHAQHYPGNGIGLAVCRRIMEHHGGRIHAESTGSGARFVLTFTLAARPREAS